MFDLIAKLKAIRDAAKEAGPLLRDAADFLHRIEGYMRDAADFLDKPVLFSSGADHDAQIVELATLKAELQELSATHANSTVAGVCRTVAEDCFRGLPAA